MVLWGISLGLGGTAKVINSLAAYERATPKTTALHSHHGLAPTPRMVWKPSEYQGRRVVIVCRVEWTVELDDGTGAERVVKRPGPVIEGQTIRAYGRSWRVDRLEPERHFAHAVPAS